MMMLLALNAAQLLFVEHCVESSAVVLSLSLSLGVIVGWRARP